MVFTCFEPFSCRHHVRKHGERLWRGAPHGHQGEHLIVLRLFQVVAALEPPIVVHDGVHGQGDEAPFKAFLKAVPGAQRSI